MGEKSNGGVGIMDLISLEFRLRKLFAVAEGLELCAETRNFEELFYALLEEVQLTEQIFNVCSEEMLKVDTP